MDRESLEELIREGATLRELAALAGVDRSTMRRRLRREGLATKHMQVLGEASAARNAGLTTIVRVCLKHGAIEHRLDARGSFRCPRCNGERVAARRRTVKDILVAEAGGACTICGYDRCSRALSFHHVDPGSKQFGLAYRGLARSLERARAEAAKCVLLCANCHMEVEHGIAELPGTVEPSDPG